jgi:hypothetical protein
MSPNDKQRRVVRLSLLCLCLLSISPAWADDLPAPDALYTHIFTQGHKTTYMWSASLESIDSSGECEGEDCDTKAEASGERTCTTVEVAALGEGLAARITCSEYEGAGINCGQNTGIEGVFYTTKGQLFRLDDADEIPKTLDGITPSLLFLSPLVAESKEAKVSSPEDGQLLRETTQSKDTWCIKEAFTPEMENSQSLSYAKTICVAHGQISMVHHWMTETGCTHDLSFKAK